MSYKIVRYDKKFRQQVLELQYDREPDLEKSAAHFAWKYEQNPYLNDPLIYLALHGEQVVGMRCLFGTKWQIGDKSDCLVVPCNADTFIAPEHRGSDLFHKITNFMLADLAKRTHPYVFNLSAGPATHMNSLLMGWRRACVFEKMERRSRLHSQIMLIRQFVSKRSRLLASVRHLITRDPHDRATRQERSREIAGLAQGERTPTGGLLSVEQSPRPKQMAELVENSGYEGRIRHVRDRSYFAWRYLNPRANYSFVFWERDKLEGYLVLQTSSDSPFAEIRIVDWEGMSVAVRTELLKGALKRIRFRELNTWAATLPEETRSILGSAGFKLVQESNNVKRTGPSLLVRGIDASIPAANWNAGGRPLLDPGSWDLRMVYSDDR